MDRHPRGAGPARGGRALAPPRPADGLPLGLAWPYLAPDGTLWVAAGERVFRRDGGRFAEAHVVPGAGYFTSMLRDREGSLWLGTENRGVIRIGPHGQEWLPPERLAQGRIASLLEDTESSIWIGANGGLFRLREALFTGWGRRDGLRSEYVRAVLEDAAGTLWVGSAGGLDRPTAASIPCRWTAATATCPRS